MELWLFTLPNRRSPAPTDDVGCQFNWASSATPGVGEILRSSGTQPPL